MAQSSASGRGHVDAYAGDLITTNPGEVHDGRPLGGASRRWYILYFEPRALADVAESSASGIEITQPVLRDPRLSRALRRLLELLAQWNTRPGVPADRLACEEALVQTCGMLLERHATVAPVRKAHADMARVRDRLADDPLDAPPLGVLGAMVGLSKYQLLRRFEKAYGVTPHAWLLQQRAERARSLIERGAALASAAAASGFADQSHMNRIFVRQFGFTPGAWKQARCPQ